MKLFSKENFCRVKWMGMIAIHKLYLVFYCHSKFYMLPVTYGPECYCNFCDEDMIAYTEEELMEFIYKYCYNFKKNNKEESGKCIFKVEVIGKEFRDLVPYEEKWQNSYARIKEYWDTKEEKYKYAGRFDTWDVEKYHLKRIEKPKDLIRSIQILIREAKINP